MDQCSKRRFAKMNLTLATLLFTLAAALPAISCNSRAPSKSSVPSTQTSHASLTVASLSPAATDLIIGMGAGGHLIAVSNYDRVGMDLPKVGDYQTTDWEKLSELHPSVMIIQMGASRLPQ